MERLHKVLRHAARSHTCAYGSAHSLGLVSVAGCVGCSAKNMSDEAFPVFQALLNAAQSGHLCNLAICAIWPPLQSAHLCNMATRAMFQALLNAVHRGVTVRLLTNDYGTLDCDGSISPLPFLLFNKISVRYLAVGFNDAAAVRVRCSFKPRARYYASTTFYHAKYMSRDGKAAAVSSINYSKTSFTKNRAPFYSSFFRSPPAARGHRRRAWRFCDFVFVFAILVSARAVRRLPPACSGMFMHAGNEAALEVGGGTRHRREQGCCEVHDGGLRG